MPIRIAETKKQVRQLKRILNEIHRCLDAQYFYPRRRTYLDATVLTLLSKSLLLAKSIVCLVQNRFPEEAFAASRTLLELALNLRYITNGRTPEVRAKRYIHFVSKEKMEWGRRAMTHFPLTREQLRRNASYKEFRAMERKFPRQSWIQASKRHAKGVWTMAMEPDRFEKAEVVDKQGKPVLDRRGRPKMKPYTWEFDYRVIYFWTSQYVHVTIDSLDNHAGVPDKVFKVYTPDGGTPRRSTNFGDMAIFNAALYTHKILIAAFRGLGHPYPDQLSKQLEAFIKSSARMEPGN